MQTPSMEPMSVGSPTSPLISGPHSVMGTPHLGTSHLGTPHMGTQSPYLPAYLFGEPASMTPSPAPRLWPGSATSPQNMSHMRPGSHSTPLTHATPPVFNSHPDKPSGRELGGKEKPGAPPVHSMMDNMLGTTPDRRMELESSVNQSAIHTPHTPAGMVHTPSGQVVDSSYYSQARKTPPSPAQIDPFYTQGEMLRADDELNETWVTVFGFPPAATSFVLQQFSQYGNILKHVIAPEGNWMHIHYQSKLQAKKALSKNGKIFGNSIMVGVTNCIDKNIMLDETQEVNNSTIHKSCYLDANQSTASTKNTPIRPLTAAYQAVKSEHQVLQSGHTPQKSSNPLSKAMDYMFGW